MHHNQEMLSSSMILRGYAASEIIHVPPGTHCSGCKEISYKEKNRTHGHCLLLKLLIKIINKNYLF